MCHEINRELQELQREFSDRLNRLVDKEIEGQGHLPSNEVMSGF